MKNLQVMCAVLSCKKFRGLPLQVHFLDTATHTDFLSQVSERQWLAEHMSVTVGTFENLPVGVSTSDNVDTEDTHFGIQTLCRECFDSFSVGDSLVRCPSCRYRFHVRCAADALKEVSQSSALIPTNGPCPGCSAELVWPLLIRDAEKFSQPCEEHSSAASGSSEDEETKDSTPETAVGGETTVKGQAAVKGDETGLSDEAVTVCGDNDLRSAGEKTKTGRRRILQSKRTDMRPGQRRKGRGGAETLPTTEHKGCRQQPVCVVLSSDEDATSQPSCTPNTPQHDLSLLERLQRLKNRS